MKDPIRETIRFEPGSIRSFLSFIFFSMFVQVLYTLTVQLAAYQTLFTELKLKKKHKKTKQNKRNRENEKEKYSQLSIRLNRDGSSQYYLHKEKLKYS